MFSRFIRVMTFAFGLVTIFTSFLEEKQKQMNTLFTQETLQPMPYRLRKRKAQPTPATEKQVLYKI